MNCIKVVKKIYSFSFLDSKIAIIALFSSSSLLSLFGRETRGEGPQKYFWFFTFASVFFLGCATTNPILVEPTLVHKDQVRVQAGGAALVPVHGHEALSKTSVSPSSNDARNEAASILMATRPGVAPMIRAQTNITRDVDGSFHYGGRDLGIGARWAVYNAKNAYAGAMTLSLGFDVHAMIVRQRDERNWANIQLDRMSGFGALLPIIFAWQSDGGLLSAYMAFTAGYDRVWAQLNSIERQDLSIDTNINRGWINSTVGIGVGFRRIRVIGEIGVQRDWLRATFDTQNVHLQLWSLTPGFALSMTF